MKKEAGIVSAIPSKRLFKSIIADYDLNCAICELIDNALDIWVKNQGTPKLKIEINLEKNQQTIEVIDNSGGIKESELKFLVAPGETSNLPEDKTIGIFGVGTKRAVVALAQEVKITSRFKNCKTYQLEFDDDWLKDNEWDLPYYVVEDIEDGKTVIELHKLRIKITDDALSHLKKHLEATYARFLNDKNVIIELNSKPLQPLTFENWAYPPKYPPHNFVGDLKNEDGKPIKVEILAGLTLESSPIEGEYGVYFYCNDRLIIRGLKSYDVGFTAGLAGKAHPRFSICRVIVSLNGEAQLMPWNSSKSNINTTHPIFLALRDMIIHIVTDYASLCRRWEGEWEEQVFKYTSGDIVEIKIDSFPNAKKSYLPPLPKSKPRYADKLKKVNRSIVKEKPWAKGLYESIAAVDLIFKQHYEQKNRICLILLDSTLEIAFKEYLVNDSGEPYNDRRLLELFGNRINVHKEIKKHIKLKSSTWRKVKHYYYLRCKLIHERATVGLSDSEIENYREVVQIVLNKLFKLKFDDL
ncbi:MAG: ATP-binding protein [Thermodesulfobacteriota bacterium]